MTELQRIIFESAIKRRCLDNDCVCMGLWALATGVLVVRLKGEEDLGFFFCYDVKSLKLEDLRSEMDKAISPLFQGIKWNYYSGHGRSFASIFRFGGNPNLIENPESALNYAKLVLSRIDGGEIIWLEFPHEIRMPF